MPSKSPEQAKLMRAIAHGWNPSRMKSPPSRAVAQEFVEADRKYSGGFAENRYWTGGLAAMNNPNAGYKGRLDWYEGGDVDPVEMPFGGYMGDIFRRAREGQDPNASPYGTEAGTTQQILERTGGSGPFGYIGTVSGLRQAGWTADTSSNEGDLRRTMWYPPERTLTGGEDNGPGGPSEPPPRIIPSAPPIAAGPLPLDKDSAYRDQLRAHKSRISSILGTGNAEGGPVNYYEEGGKVRPGHGEGANPHPPNSARYKLWERKHHIDPPPPIIAKADPEESFGWLERLLGIDKARTRSEKELEDLGEARGGRVGYQAGGLAMAAPAGGVPPWIEPTGSGPGYMDSPDYMEEPPPGYQFGGMAPAMKAMRQYRGVPPQRGGIRRGAPPGEDIRGGLAAMMQQARSQRGAIPGGGMMQIGPGGTIPGRGGRGQPPIPRGMPGSVGIPSGEMPGEFLRPGPGGDGKPGRGIIPLASDEGGGGIPGGPRVPPNMRGYLQRQRMMNRPPANVGGGANRVGMQDQQGGMARALQRGTGRPPMSRRSAFPGTRR